MSIEEKILNDNSCSPYVDKGRGYVEIAFKDGAYWGYEEGCKTMIDKACEWITEHIDIPYEGEFIDDSPVASDYVEYLSKRLEYAKAIADAFKQAMEEQL